MTIAISSQMASSLLALTNTNDDVMKTQRRLATGLEVASASDNIAVYFKARSYNNRATDLDTTNKAIGQAAANLDIVDKALANMQDSLKGAVQLMKDARAKAVTVQKAATTAGGQVYQSVTNATQTLKGAIVQPLAATVGTTATSADSGSFFQVGDAFGVTLTDSTSGQKVTKYFRATDPAAAIPATAVNGAGQTVNGNGTVVAAAAAATANGATFNQAMNFNDLDSLKNAMQSAFGYDSLTMNLTVGGTAGAQTYKLGFAMANTSQSLTFFQANDQPVGTGTGTPLNAGAAFDFDALFGKMQNATNANYGTSSTPTSETFTFLGANNGAGAVTGGTTFGSVGGAANNADVAYQARLDAANFFRQTLIGLDNLVKDASLPGYSNLLKGELLSVNLNDTGDVKQNIQLTQKGDPASLGFVGYAVNGQGVANTAFTGDDFRTDNNIDTSINQANNATSVLRQIQTILAAAKVAMNSRLDYNKAVVSSLSSGATEMTAADTNREAANLAALQNRQAFAVNNLTGTKSAEQSLIQLLR